MLKIAINGLIWHYMDSFGFSWIFSASPPPPIRLRPRRGPTGTENFESPSHQKFREKTLSHMINYRGFAQHSTHLFKHDFSLSLGFPICTVR